MNEDSRRDAIKKLGGLGVGAYCGGFGPAGAAEAPTKSTLIREENARPGTREWMLTTPRIDPKSKYRCPWIEGYCSKTSVRAGEKITFHVKTDPAERFTIDLYRLGYYGGKGGRFLRRLGPFEGVAHDDPPVGEKRERRCAWPACAELIIPDDWLSGVYLGKLTEEGEGVQKEGVPHPIKQLLGFPLAAGNQCVIRSRILLVLSIWTGQRRSASQRRD